MISSFKTGLLAATAFLAFAVMPLAAHAEPAVKPAMWVIRDADSTIYLLGSIHVMKPGTPWLTPAIQQGFDSAQNVWFEIPDLDDKATAGPLAQKYMFDPNGNMSAGLTMEEIAQVDALLKPSGMNSAMLKNMRKWAVGLIITLQQINGLGYETETGVDVTLMKQARGTKKGVHGFETMQSQLESLVPENEDDELTSLRTTLKDSATLPQDINDLFAAWKVGDTDEIKRQMIDKMQAEDAKSYQRLIVERNAAWEPQIEQILAGKGTAFITVGAGHLVGPDSVLAMLKAHGISAQRVQ